MSATVKLPDWTRDELILALDLFFRLNPSHTSETNPEIVALSKLLRRLPINVTHSYPERFRNPNGVYMKMCNFLRVDPSYTEKGLKGLKGGSQQDVKVWAEFSTDRTRLQAVAKAIRASAEIGGEEGTALQDISDDYDEAPEGKVLTRLHKFRERNRDLVEKKKRRTLELRKCLSCEVCGFDFSDVYGDLGYGFIECHHTAPISQLQPGQKTRLIELALVCSNCHRMLHRGNRWMSVEELRCVLRSTRQEPPRAR